MNHAIVTIKNKVVKHHWFSSSHEALRAALQFEKHGTYGDIYWAIADFTARQRTEENVQSLQYFWLDLDCGPGKPYASKADAAKALYASPFPTCSILVDSGNGLHVYWKLEEPVPVADWKATAEHLKRACITHNLNADHAITADCARILRVPGTTNHKGEPKATRVLKKSDRVYTLEAFSQALPKVGPIRQPTAPLPDEWSVDAGDYPPAKLENVLGGCKQMREAARVRSNGIAEPYWRAVLSVVSRCEGGDKLIHAVSKGDARYDPSETERKAAGTKGPATCAHFSAVNPTGCAGCPWAGGVTSPIAIPAPAPKPETSQQKWDDRVGDWHITAKGVYKSIEDDEGNRSKAWAVMTQVYGETYRSRRGETDTDADDAKILLVWRRPDDRWRRTLLPLSLLGSSTKMMEWAGAQGLANLIPNPKVWSMFISELTTKLLQDRRVTEYYARLGWHSDSSEFVLGTRRVTAEGAEDAVVERNSPLASLTPTGDLEDWKQGISRLNKQGLEKHQFCILAGFGSPLLDLMDVNGAVVSLAGPSGRGKTLAAKAALSIFGNPDQLFQSADATKNSVDVHLSTLHSVPYLMDEVTTLSDKAIGDLLYKVANGRGKDALRRSRDWSTGGSWKLVAFLTTNRPIMEADQSHLTEAQRNRAIELYIDNTVPRDDAAEVYRTTSHNYGVAGEAFMQYVIANRGACRTVALQCVEKLKDQFEGQDGQRFGIWALAAAMAGGIIAKKLGLIPFNPWGVITAVVPALQAQRETTLTPEALFLEALREWLAEESARVTVCANGRMGFTDNPVARRDGPDLYLHSSALRAALRDRGVSMAVAKRILKDNSEQNLRMRLSQGAPPVRCIKVPTGMVYDE